MLKKLIWLLQIFSQLANVGLGFFHCLAAKTPCFWHVLFPMASSLPACCSIFEDSVPQKGRGLRAALCEVSLLGSAVTCLWVS